MRPVGAGVAVGLVLAWLLAEVQGPHRRRADRDHPVVPRAVRDLPGRAGPHVSGVLAVAVAGIYAGRRSHEMLTPLSRMQGLAFWEVVLFLLNGLVFILIGLQLPARAVRPAGPAGRRAAGHRGRDQPHGRPVPLRVGVPRDVPAAGT